MLFGEAGKFKALFATHPPLLQRIHALEPGFREEDLTRFATCGSVDDAAARRVWLLAMQQAFPGETLA